MRTRAAALAVMATVAAALLAPAGAGADGAATVTVVGPSALTDSGLEQDVIAPQFKAAFPQDTLHYNGSASTTAIQSAENGTGGPSVLILGDPTAESGFVAGGFSANGQPGDAIFTGDDVLAGPTTDATHADVAADGAHNVVRAFADVAVAGVAAHATFVTRGGSTTAPDTTVLEHAIWALVSSSGQVPAGVVLCDVSLADGGGMSPINSTVQGTSGQLCPDGGTVSSGDAPPWYVTAVGNQSAAVVAANACALGVSGANSCYILTDRGTFDDLASGNDPAGTIPSLAILARDDAPSAPGGANLLVRSFHAYVINPAKPGELVDLPGAQDYVGFLTSPALQAQIDAYLDTTADPGGVPFHADAIPALTSTPSTGSVVAGQPVTVTGSVTNRAPGAPALAGQPVTVARLAGSAPVAVGAANTDAGGGYTITFTPPASGAYEVQTGPLTQLERLVPSYSDVLSPSTGPPFAVTVAGTATISGVTVAPGAITVAGMVGPVAPDANARVTLLARPATSSGVFGVVGGQALAAGQSAFSAGAFLSAGTWSVEAQYADDGLLTTATSATSKVTVPAAASTTTVSFKKVSVRSGEVTVTGTLSVAPHGVGASVRLFALATGHVSRTKAKKKKKKTRPKATKAAATFRQAARVAIRTGARTFTIRHRFTRGMRYALQLEYVHSGQTTTHSSYRYLAVH